MKNKNAMSRKGRRTGQKSDRMKNIQAYYKRFRNGRNRHNPGQTPYASPEAKARIAAEAASKARAAETAKGSK